MRKADQKPVEYAALESFDVAHPRAFGISVMRVKDTDSGNWIYRPLVEIDSETDDGTSHMNMIFLDIYDTDLYNACYDAVVAASIFAPGYYDQITVFDEDSSSSEDAIGFTVADIMADIDTPLVSDTDVSTDRVLH